jgi:hypothetical protein
VHRELLRRLNAVSQIDWSRGTVDASHIRSFEGLLTGPSRLTARIGSKHHLIIDSRALCSAGAAFGRNPTTLCAATRLPTQAAVAL